VGRSSHGRRIFSGPVKVPIFFNSAHRVRGQRGRIFRETGTANRVSVQGFGEMRRKCTSPGAPRCRWPTCLGGYSGGWPGSGVERETLLEVKLSAHPGSGGRHAHRHSHVSAGNPEGRLAYCINPFAYATALRVAHSGSNAGWEAQAMFGLARRPPFGARVIRAARGRPRRVVASIRGPRVTTGVPAVLAGHHGRRAGLPTDPRQLGHPGRLRSSEEAATRGIHAGRPRRARRSRRYRKRPAWAGGMPGAPSWTSGQTGEGKEKTGG